MKQSIFKKELTATGKYGMHKAEIVATMNYTTKTVIGTSAGTHDDYSRQVPVHKVEIFIDGEIHERQIEILSENEVYNECERLIEFGQSVINGLANEAPVKTFIEKMNELFS